MRLQDFLKQERVDHKIFIVVKPGFIDKANQIIDIFENHGFKLFQTRTKQLLEKEAKSLYYVHHKEDFYYGLCKYMASDVSMGVTFTYDMDDEEAFKLCDKLKDQVREKWSESDMRNVMHSSDSFQNMSKESKFYFA